MSKSFELSPKQKEVRDLLAGPERHNLIFGGSRCLSGDAVLDGHQRTIAELALAGQPVWVQTTRGLILADVPFAKGLDELLRVTMADGRSVRVTSDHRFWNGDQWVRAENVRAGDLLAVRSSEPCPPGSNSALDLSMSGADARRCFQIHEDWTDDCSDNRRRCDPLPLRVPVRAPGHHASQSYGQVHIQSGPCHPCPSEQLPESNSHKGHPSGRAGECIHSDQGLSRRSNMDGFPSTYHGGQWSDLGVEQTSSPSHGTHQAGLRSQSPSCPPRSSAQLSDCDAYQFAQKLGLSYDTPCPTGYGLASVSSVTRSAKEVFYTLHVPCVEHFFANGILHHNSGKTLLLNYVVATRAISAPKSRHLIARLHNIDVRQAVLMDTWPTMMRLAYPQVTFETNKQDQYVTLANGSEVWFGGLDDKERVDKILGKEFVSVYVNEASQVSYETVLTLRTRLAQNCTKVNGSPMKLKAYYDLNPSGRGHWTYREFVLGKRVENDVDIEPGTRRYAVMNPTDNPYLSPAYLSELASLPERQRQRFFEGTYLSEAPGTLWPMAILERCRVDKVPDLQRIVVAVDPSGTSGAGNGDSIGIVVAGIGIDGRCYILADRTCNLSPDGWGRRVVEAYHEFGADRVVAERNFGGAMVEHVIRTVDRKISYKEVTANSRTGGKRARAEPVAALYEQGSVFHHGRFQPLEDQLGSFTTDGYAGEGSPDRADALVWAVTELMLSPQAPVAQFGRYGVRR